LAKERTKLLVQIAFFSKNMKATGSYDEKIDDTKGPGCVA
jgi:hypothetical protein